MDASIAFALAGSVVSVLVPYLKKAGEGVAESAGKAAWGAVSHIYDFLRLKLSATPNGERALATLQENPDDAAAQEAMRLEIEALSKDGGLRSQLIALLKKANDAGVDVVFKTNIAGDVKKLVQVGVVHGDLNF